MAHLQNMFALDGRIALVTGAARGLGFEIAKALVGQGATVLLNGRNPAALQTAAAQIGPGASTLPFHIPDEAAAEAARARIGRLDILVNNVGLRDRRPLDAFALAEVRNLIEANLVAPFALSRRAAALMRPNGWGRIVNITSIAGPIARAGDPVYTMA